ncbi:hypothetical protein [Pseudoclavibacter sp. Z016]|uniref:hypothetical protein n=1 Tax=Pseudoclavibacter sp. Z016 TaxID=2080581 RepID=UPI000CE8E254|nr:hypothetical protein [Pseudoclavibacter sp. Z016]PPF72632.1 hypothetical protein C5B99_17490 [Pseudoclavibacter sp. Z016]
MANNEENTSSPFTRPGFIVAAIVVAIVLTLGITLTVVGAFSRNEDDAVAEPTSTSDQPSDTTQPPSPSAPEAVEPDGGGSVCGLPGEELSGTLSEAPATEWAYQGVIPYPTSTEHGPGETGPSGVRTCFQHTPAGALFMAANAMSQGSDATTATEWIEASLSQGPYREQLLSEAGAGAASSNIRVNVAGYKILSYDGASATVDLAARISSSGENTVVSSIYYLVWEDGDWKIDASNIAPMNITPIPDVAGYTAWGV